MDKWQQVKSFN